ncbi:RagB/SusD family nutrient uptake outer membrane protein [uncultured Fibrella sp.]|uniref:RagB/SusD family nutrient uptake outer membrane protein n=1 Tax=uncultured Fibrella sp. TaxID=1284596 RepID=UPI0035C9FC72
MKKILILSTLTGLLLLQNACKQQDYLNPSTASQPQVVGTPDGLITVCNALQYRYTTGGGASVIYTSLAAGGLTTGELTVLNAGNSEELALNQGQSNVTNSNGVVRNLWTQSNLVKANADLVLANLNTVTDAGTKSGIQGYAAIFRALALGTLGQFFQTAPIAVGENVPFVDRVQLFREAVATLEAAATQVAAAPVSANFTGKIVPGIDIANTIQALIARYSLFAGDYDKALAAAAKVDLTKKSVFSFDDNSRNPVFFTAFSNVNVIAPTNATLGLPAALAPNPADKRLAVYIRPVPVSTLNLGTGFFTANNAQIPVYLPGEMLLIQAEAAARKNDLTNAVAQLNKVLTKTPAQDAFGVGAALPAYAGASTQADILTEIYRNRQLELAYQGFRLEDSRRFGRPGPTAAGSERNRNFMPYPRTETDNNTSAPTADPG